MGDKNLIEYSNMVFTKKQCNLHYGQTAPLPQEIKQCFVQKPILFLGCSLEQDLTMDVLDSILVPGINHYAILKQQRLRNGSIRQ
ncbi:MAG: hypothetical protein HFH52_00065 [Lachnospiraceae bacterium]|nr:hypothetical protein [Lachnospiraceae bacterium]